MLLQDPDTLVVLQMVCELPYSKRFWSDPRARDALRYAIRTAPTHAILDAAVEGFRRLSLTDLREAIDARMADAKRRLDTSEVAMLLDEEDRVIHWHDGFSMPACLREPPRSSR
jgi:hypothetical protein